MKLLTKYTFEMRVTKYGETTEEGHEPDKVLNEFIRPIHSHGMGVFQLVGYCLDELYGDYGVFHRVDYEGYDRAGFDWIVNRLGEIDNDIPEEGGKDYAHLLTLFHGDTQTTFFLGVEKVPQKENK